MGQGREGEGRVIFIFYKTKSLWFLFKKPLRTLVLFLDPNEYPMAGLSPSRTITPPQRLSTEIKLAEGLRRGYQGQILGHA